MAICQSCEHFELRDDPMGAQHIGHCTGFYTTGSPVVVWESSYACPNYKAKVPDLAQIEGEETP